jgi:hypothetical protein
MKRQTAKLASGENLDFPFHSRIAIHTMMLFNGWEARLPDLIQFSLMHVWDDDA